MSREEQPDDTVNRESHPNAGGPEGLSGDMGVSSERTGPFEGVEGTGSAASVQDSTDGEVPTARSDEELDERLEEEKPDDTAAASGIDRTVGEVQPDQVKSHPFDPSRNPGH